jgi:DNA replication protein DnaC
MRVPPRSNLTGRIGNPGGATTVERLPVRSTILTSQLPVSRWHEQIGDPTLADGILDRLVHNAHIIEMRGDSMRKNRGKPNA